MSRIEMDGNTHPRHCNCGTFVEPEPGPALVADNGTPICADCATEDEFKITCFARLTWCVSEQARDPLHRYLHIDGCRYASVRVTGETLEEVNQALTEAQGVVN